MATRISEDAQNAAADAIAGLLDAGVAAGYIEVRTGAQPATVGTVASGTLLGTLTLSDPAFAAAVAGSAAADPITGDSSADASGTAGWFRGYDSNGAAKIDGSITASGGGGDMELDDINVVAGGTITVNAWSIVMPSGA